jgi:hypothetical protein
LLTSELYFKNGKPKPEKLRFFVEKGGLDADLDLTCIEMSSLEWKIQAEFSVRGGLYSKMIPIESYKESVKFEPHFKRTLVRCTRFKSGKIVETQKSWSVPDLFSTAEAFWVIEAAWKVVNETSCKEVPFQIFDGKEPRRGIVQRLEKAPVGGLSFAVLKIQTKNPLSLMLTFANEKLNSVSFQIPLLGNIRLVRRYE